MDDTIFVPRTRKRVHTDSIMDGLSRPPKLPEFSILHLSSPKRREPESDDDLRPENRLKASREERKRSKSYDSEVFDGVFQEYIRHSENIRDVRRPWSGDTPENIVDPAKITESHARHAEFYAHYRLKSRRVSPRSEAFLKLYERRARETKEIPTPRRKAVLAALNETLHSKAFLKYELSPAEWKRIGEIQELHRIEYMTTYSDYLAEECMRFREAATSRGISEVAEFAGGQTWIKVVEKIKEEERAWGRWKKGSKKPETPVQDAITAACYDLNIDPKYTMRTIEWYAARNDRMHSRIAELIRAFDHKKLAKRLARDIVMLPKVVSGKERAFMQQVLENIRDRYFESLHLINPDLSLPKAEWMHKYAQHIEREAVKQERKRDLELASRRKQAGEDTEVKDNASNRRKARKAANSEKSLDG